MNAILIWRSPWWEDRLNLSEKHVSKGLLTDKMQLVTMSPGETTNCHQQAQAKADKSVDPSNVEWCLGRPLTWSPQKDQLEKQAFKQGSCDPGES